MHNKPHENGTPAAERERGILGNKDWNPQELLGDLNKSDLPRNVVLAAGLTFAGLALISVVPLLLNLLPAKAAPEDKGPVASEVAPAPKTEAAKKETAKTAPDILDKPATDPLTAKPKTGIDPLDKLGVSETKPADSKKNPLDKGVDDLLKDIK